MTDQLADLLDDTADAIETYGHIKGQGGAPEVGFCIAGAITYAHAQRYGLARDDIANADFGEACAALTRTIGLPSEMDPGLFVVDWNDAEERTAQEVLDLIRETAKEERS